MHSVDKLIAFALQHPFGEGWPTQMLERFLKQHISSNSLILTLPQEGEPAALAVLLDKMTNPGNNASLEILGIRPGVSLEECLDRFCALARERLPSSRSGFETALPSSLTSRDEIAARNQLEPYYETCGMLNESPGSAPPPPGGLCTIVTDRDEEELYGVLVRCFQDNVDTNLPEFADWQTARRAPSRSKTWGIWKNKELVAFLNLVVPLDVSIAEIRTVGVVPEHRGQGYAKALIQRALGYTAQLEISRCVLTVSVQNRNALRLYQGLGFQEKDHQSIYRWKAK